MLMSRRFLFAAFLGLAFALWGGCSMTRSTSSSSPSSPDRVVLASYADTVLTLDAFERRYAQSVGGPEPAADDSMAAYRDFLERLVNFKLKVRAARAAGLDTLDSFRSEVRDYRQRMAEPRIRSERIMEPIVREVYERKKQEVDVSHILLRVPQDAAPEDTTAAYQNMQSLVDSLQQGVSFRDLAYRHSEDPSAQQQGRPGYRGHLGYITAGQVVKPFEDRLYTTPEGEISDIFRTQFGVHVLKVHDRRARQPEVRLSHLYIRPDGQGPQEQARARRLADSLRAELDEGSDFGSLARQYSDDRRSAQKGGDLGFVQPSQRLPEAFLGALDTLKVGETSDVLDTRFGYHIIKLVDRKAQRSFEEAYEDLKEQVAQMPRVQRRKASLAQTILAENDSAVDTSAIRNALQVASLDTSAQVVSAVASDSSLADRSILRIGERAYTLGEWAEHVRSTDRRFSSLSDALQGFINETALLFAARQLEARDPDFAAQMDEYREGVLLFRYMQDSVWTVAAQDTSLLRETYRSNKDQYRFPERVRTLALHSPADSLLQPYMTAHRNGTPRRQIVQRAAADSLVRVDTTHVTDSSSAPYTQMLSVQDGTAAGPLQNDNEWLYLIRDAELPARPKTFQEARSEVLSDAQAIYEERVHQQLRDRYNATLYPERLQRAFRSDAATAASETDAVQ